VYLRWLDEDVRWIITPQERAEFVALSNGKARDRFIADFWARRDPTPGTPENEYKEEHYRRMAYANANFAAALMAGWQTDRGRAYIQLGPPDSRQVRPGMPPSEVWQYNTRVHRTLTFVDECECGEYKLQGPTKREYVP
jgi:GWxTD domain-containing protein